MAGKVEPVSLGGLSELPRTCPDCDRIVDADRAAWVSDTVRSWGQVGWQLRGDGSDAGTPGPVEAAVLIAPAEHRPAAGPLAEAPVSADAAVLVSLRIVPGLRGEGLGRQLIRASAALALRSGRRGLEAIGTRGPGRCCLLGVDWLESAGFVITRDHPLTPRLRMELSTTLTWRVDLEAAWQRLAGLVVPAPPPEPVSRATRTAIPAGR